MKYIFIFLLVLLFVVSPVHAAPASLSFDPVDIQTSLGKPFEITVNIFTGGMPVASTDIWLNYDANSIKPVLENTKTGSLFQTIDVKEIEPGKLYIYGIQKNPHNEVEAMQGTIATIQFISLESGPTQLSFDCDSSKKSSSQIIAADKDLTNLISCTATAAHSVSITITEDNVLGASTENNIVNQLSYILGIIVITFSIVLFIRYHRIPHEIS